MIPVRRVVAAELLKVRSTRSYRSSVVVAAACVVGAAAVMAALTGRGASEWDPEPVALPLEYFAYVMMVVGVLMVTAEFANGTAAITHSLVPWRSRLLLGKYLAALVMAVAASLVVGVLVVLATWAASGVSPAALVAQGEAPVLVSGLAAICVATVLGVAFGTLLRVGSAAVALLLSWSFLLETFLVLAVPERFGAFLPFKTFGGSRLLMGELGAAEGLAVFAAYAAVVVALAAVAQSRRDAPVA